jgi:uncharacterized protein (DUF697 family)
MGSLSVNKKKLPKVIRPPANDFGEALAGHGAVAQQDGRANKTSFEQAAYGKAAVLQSSHVAEADETAAPPGSSVRDTLPPPAWTHGDTRAARRRSRANTIVERHAVYSGFGGIIPIPVANIATITAIIVRMVKALSSLYGVPFQRDRARAIVIGLMGGTMPTGLAVATSSTLVYIIPASGVIGLAVSSLAAVACTRSIGRIFVEHFESGETLHQLSMIENR